MKVSLAALLNGRWNPHGVVANLLNCDILASLNVNRAITLAFKQIPLGKAWTHLSLPQLRVKQYQNCSSTRLALVENNPRELESH